MKKTLILFLLALSFSCSNSDSDPILPSLSEPKLPTIITFNDGYTKTLTLTYDRRHRLSTFTEYDEIEDLSTVFTLTYDDNDRLVLVDQMAPDFNQPIEFAYDNSGRLCSWIYYGQTRPVYYDQGIYAIPIGGLSTTYAYDDMNDITMISNGNPATFQYDESKNGAFRNVVGNYQLLSVFMYTSFLRCGTKKALLSVTSANPMPRYSYTMTNTYDNEGYITSFISLRGDGEQSSATIIYNN